MARSDCEHKRAKFYAVQKFGNLKSIRLYNCPDCKSTISEHTLRAGRRAVAVAR